MAPVVSLPPFKAFVVSQDLGMYKALGTDKNGSIGVKVPFVRGTNPWDNTPWDRQHIRAIINSSLFIF
jgi:hypothetical protein